MISCQHVHYALAHKTLLEDISLTIESGTITALLGANGAGKSTLLKVLLGIYTPSKGQVNICQRPLAQWQNQELAKIRAYMAQSSTTTLALPVYDYLSLARLHWQESQEASNKKIEQVIHELSLAPLATKSITQLSGGEWQRVQLARAWCQLLNQQDYVGTLLILDEPSSALDIHQSQLLYQHLQAFTRKGGTVLVVEHDINLAARFSDNIVLLKDGRILAQGKVKHTFNDHNINRCFNVYGKVLRREKDQAQSFVL